jgi:transketolase
MAHAIRFLAMDTITRAQDGHPGTPLGAADICTALFRRHLKFDPANPEWPDRDRFVQSNGHGSTLLYSLLCLTGYQAISIEEMKRFRELGSNTPGHPEYNPAHGIEITTGPLGQGIANAVGMAVAEAMLNAEFGDDIVNHRTYALVGDGCLMEGIGHEVISLAGHLRLGKLTFLYDSNRMTDDGATGQAISEDYMVRFACAGWHVQECDGHDQDAVSAALAAAHADPRPSMIKCNTFIGFGIPRIQDKRVAHGGKLFEEDCRAARAHLGWPHEPFVVPPELLGEWRKPGQRGAAAREAWLSRLSRLDAATRARFERLMKRALPVGWDKGLLDYKRQAAEKRLAQPTVRSSGEISAVLSRVLPELVGGAPDLEAATQHKHDMVPFTAQNCSGRYLHYGIREHAMGAMLNGMVAHGGVVPFGVTFLVFSDYMRHAIRLSAMMSLPVIWVFSHDSIGIGRNGPTHQPVEYLASLRAMPNLRVMRPCDAVETAECWQLAVSNRTSPTAIAKRWPGCATVIRRLTGLRVALTCWPMPPAGLGGQPCLRLAPKWRLRAARVRRCKRKACRPRWSRCHVGSCSRNRTPTIALPSWGAAPRGWRWRLRYSSAGNVSSAMMAALSACTRSALRLPRPSCSGISASRPRPWSQR